MPTINKTKSYAPISRAPINVPSDVPDGWLEQLIDIICKTIIVPEPQKLRDDLYRHAGPNSAYRLKSQLQESLKFIYLTFLNPTTSADQKTSFALKLTEGSMNCTAGFHDRTNEIIESLKLPGSLDEVLALIRQGLVSQAAIQTSNEIHAYNRFFVVAKNDYGVQPLNPEDQYRGAIPDEIIQKKLKEIFNKDYDQLFGNLNLLYEQLTSYLNAQGYRGRVEEGYEYADFSKLGDFFNSFLNISARNLFVIKGDEEDYDVKVLDVDFRKYKLALLEEYKEKKYFDLSLSEEQFLNSLILYLKDELSSDEFQALLNAQPGWGSFFKSTNAFSQLLRFIKEWPTEKRTAIYQAAVNVELISLIDDLKLAIDQKDNHRIIEVINYLSPLQVNTPLKFNETPLYVASKLGQIESVKLLLAKNADVNLAQHDGQTPLFAASNNGYLEIVKLLLEKNADVNLTTQNGMTPLYCAIARGYLEIVHLLLKKNADVNLAIKGGAGGTPLYCAVSKDNLQIVHLLLDKNADVNLPSIDRFTPLAMAAYRGNFDIVKLLLEKGADPNLPLPGGSTLLYHAAMKGQYAIVKLLLEKGAINLAYNTQTPLCAALGNKHLDVVRLFLEKNADSDDGVCSALELAVLWRNLEAIPLFLRHGVSSRSIKLVGNKVQIVAGRGINEIESIEISQLLKPAIIINKLLDSFESLDYSYRKNLFKSFYALSHSITTENEFAVIVEILKNKNLPLTKKTASVIPKVLPALADPTLQLESNFKDQIKSYCKDTLSAPSKTPTEVVNKITLAKLLSSYPEFQDAILEEKNQRALYYKALYATKDTGKIHAALSELTEVEPTARVDLGLYYLQLSQSEKSRDFISSVTGESFATRAFKELSKAYATGDKNACWYLGNCYRDGVGVKKDTGKALEYYTQYMQMRKEEVPEPQDDAKLKNHLATIHPLEEKLYQVMKDADSDTARKDALNEYFEELAQFYFHSAVTQHDSFSLDQLKKLKNPYWEGRYYQECYDQGLKRDSGILGIFKNSYKKLAQSCFQVALTKGDARAATYVQNPSEAPPDTSYNASPSLAKQGLFVKSKRKKTKKAVTKPSSKYER